MEERRITTKLRRVFNLFSKSFLYYFILAVVLFLVIAVIVGIDSLLTNFFLIIFASCVALCFFYPKELLVERNSIQYQVWARASGGGLGWRVRGMPVKATYTIWLVKKIAFYQNPVERLFGVGHIRVYGNTEVQAKWWQDLVKIPEPHVIWGIPNFEEFRRQAQELLGENVEIVSNIE